jgi:hypothetical protein
MAGEAWVDPGAGVEGVGDVEAPCVVCGVGVGTEFDAGVCWGASVLVGVGAPGGGRSSCPSVSRLRFVPREEDSFNPNEVAFINI